MRGRTRSIKPETFADEKLWDADVRNPGQHILRVFEGLWCFADREGRFEWRPRALKAHILPYWDGDMEMPLEVLRAAGFIRKYTVADASGTRDYGVVCNFLKHQTPNNRENASQIPEPPEESTRNLRVLDAFGTRDDSPSIQKKSSGSGSGILDPGSWERESRAAGATNDPPPPDGPKGPKEAQSPARGPFDERAMFELFASTFRQLRRDEPKLTGRDLGGFHARVLESAKARGVDPRAHFAARLHRWLMREDWKPIELASPLACFAAEWGALIEDGEAVDAKTALTRKSMAALARKDLDEYERLNRELGEMDRAAGE